MRGEESPRIWLLVVHPQRTHTPFSNPPSCGFSFDSSMKLMNHANEINRLYFNNKCKKSVMNLFLITCQSKSKKELKRSETDR